MNKKTLLFSIFMCSLPVVQSCSSDADALDEADFVLPVAPASQEPDAAYYPKDDGAPALPREAADALAALMENIHPNMALEKGELQITDEQMAEIKTFVDTNLAKATVRETYLAVFNWLITNLTYVYQGTAYVDPYDVFINKRCVCQGYANLLKAMLLTQGIPTFTVNGYLGDIGAHAWAYTNLDGEWWVSDPTNGMHFRMSDLDNYRRKLIPLRTELTLFEDDYCTYNYTDGRLNVASVKPGTGDVLVVPFSAGGYRVTSFAPNTPLPENYKTVYLSACITDFGQSLNLTAGNTVNVENIFIDPANTEFEVYKGIVYRKYQDEPYFVPAGAHRVELRPMKCVGKNTLVDLPYVEEVVIADGTTEVESYAIENCPSLKRVYVPESVTVFPADAVYRCPADVEIIRGSTGIGHIRL